MDNEFGERRTHHKTKLLITLKRNMPTFFNLSNFQTHRNTNEEKNYSDIKMVAVFHILADLNDDLSQTLLGLNRNYTMFS